MSSDKKIFWISVAVLVVIAAVLLLSPRVEELTAPRLLDAHVAIQPAGAGAARMGPVELPAGEPFTLHAVLRAETRGGETLWYTEAPALEVDGAPVPADSIRRWDRSQTVKVLWFTVEGARPILELQPGQGLERFHMLEFLRDDWPYSWSVPGVLEPKNDDPFGGPASQVARPFGTQRYQVRIELWRDPAEDLIPEQRYVSPGVEALPAEADGFATVTAALPGPAGPASAVFGLTHVVPPERPELGAPGADGTPEEGELLRGLVDLTRRRLAFGTLPVLREVIEAAGREPGALPWSYVSLDGAVAWGEEVRPGDLLRAGSRVVVLYADAAPEQRDEAEPAPGDGVLDRDDLCFDFALGAAVRSLGEVFEGEGGQVEWVALGRD